MPIIIRPSSLPSFPDCARRTAARLAPNIVKEMGYDLRQLPQRAGPAVGTATHAAVAHTMQSKIDTGSSANQTETEQAGLQALDDTTANGVEWDGVTPNFNTAQKQVLRHYRVFRLHLEDDLRPKTVERRIEKVTKRGNTLSGQPDVTDDGVMDLKTGVARRANGSQYGAYALLLRADGDPASHITEDYIQRVAIDKEQPVPQQISYDVELSERIAGRIIMDIERAFEEFEREGDNLVFLANPGSMLCSDRWCQAWGTSFCEEGKR
uniref:PD-(D/E)XK endonuclease-like domain-containing protein n=1 Tax=viral metagenome TaxID=1070528 RepID=A0A6M3KGB7_9ZZZZ